MTGRDKDGPGFKDVVALVRSLTGREPTPEELAEARADWAEL